jgi:hypothetical protein
MIKIVLDVKTLRVIYYTEDANQDLVIHYDTILFEYDKPLPNGMSLTNCWNWRLVGDTFVPDTPQINTPQTILEHNRNEVRRLLEQRINECRSGLNLYSHVLNIKTNDIKTDNMDFLTLLAQAKGVTLDYYVDMIDKEDYNLGVDLRNTEINYEYFNRLIISCMDMEQLFALRDRIYNTDLKELLNDYR